MITTNALEKLLNTRSRIVFLLRQISGALKVSVLIDGQEPEFWRPDIKTYDR